MEFEKFHFFNGYFPNGGAEELDENGKPIPGRFKRCLLYTSCCMEAPMRRTYRSLLPAALILLCGLLASCLSSGPEKPLGAMADAMEKNDSAAFLAQMDTPNQRRSNAPLG